MTINAFSAAEDGSVGRGLPGPNRPSTSWRQTLLVPPELVTLRLDLGWARGPNLGMFAAEAYVSNTRELLALEVHPTRGYSTMQEWLDAAQTWQRAVVLDLFDPDPF